MPDKKRTFKTIIFFMLLFGYYLFMKHTGLGIPCPIRYFFHIQCPGCGISHMLLSLLQGNYRKAFFYHPVIFVSLPFLTYLIVKMLYGYLFCKTIHWRRIENAGIILLIFVLILYTVYRNLLTFL